MLERFFEVKSFGLHISTPKQVRGNIVFDVSKMATVCIMAMHHCYVSWLCIIAMYHGYVSWLCIMAMYHGYVSWHHGYVSRLCITAMYHGYVSWLCIMAMYHGYVYYITYITHYKKRQQRIQEGQFLKNTLNLVLIPDSESTQKSVQIRTGIIDS